MTKLTPLQVQTAATIFYGNSAGCNPGIRVIEMLAENLQYAPTELGAPLSDVEWSELVHRPWGFLRNEPDNYYRKVADLALAMRNTAHPVLKEQQCDGSCDNDWCTAVPAPAPIISAAQGDWNDQHGHRTEILPLIGGEPAKKAEAAPVDGDLVGRALDCYDSVFSVDSWRSYCKSDRVRFRKGMTAVVRLLADELLGLVTPTEDEEFVGFDGGRMASMQNFVDRRRARIEAKPQTLEERIHAILMGSDSVTDKFNAVMALIPNRAINREAL